MLLIDTNVLVRCSQGRAMARLDRLIARDANVATTDRNAQEMRDILTSAFALDRENAARESERVLDAMHVIPVAVYESQRTTATQRLAIGGQSDWPLLAAALALGGEIWSDDRDFFGVGVSVWSSANVLSYEPARA